MWTYSGEKRPPFAITPEPGQESVWDYPRPPKLVADHRRIVVQRSDLLIADSRETCRVLETAGPPTFYIPPRDVHADLLKPFPGTSICEWKGAAQVLDIGNVDIAKGSDRLELSEGASPIRRDCQLLFLLSRSRRLFRRWRARAPTARLFLRRLDNQRNSRSMERGAGDGRMVAGVVWVKAAMALFFIDRLRSTSTPAAITRRRLFILRRQVAPQLH